ncbi:reverse transcriptase domain-containing protein [Lacticaseibacillus paracasei]|uniref:reverse transcriptase domain-containing protein n=1 Tax=Lacticaseibacillus paracasei TaxID=1597 RepID=UPI00194EB2EA|nr:reverse transcriptase domain-containing protein [Lacticaseibacillus paracasei]MBM6414755.1 trypsin-like peptidase domain-containing protein [Lacticaseibacillus paracasei]
MDNPFSELDTNEISASFRHISNVSELASFLGVTRQKLFYYCAEHLNKKHYELFDIPKKNGGTRTIEEPTKGLKLIQKKIAFAVSINYHPAACVSAFTEGRSIRYGAERHKGARKVVCFDLENFFPSCPQYKVFGVFYKFFKLPKEVSDCLARLCCYKKHLAQGGPSSPILSNVMLNSMDKKFLSLAKKTKTVYTRYADDMSFSSKGDMPSLIWQNNNISSYITSIVQESGFHIKQEKTRILGRSCRMQVTGVVINKFPNVPRTYYRRVRAMLHNFKTTKDYEETKKNFLKYYGKSDDCNPAKVIQGMISYIFQVRNDGGTHSTLARNMMQEFNTIQWPGNEKFKVEMAMPHSYKLHKAVFAVETKIGEDFFYGTAFLCNNKIISCSHIFKKGHEKKLSDEIEYVHLIEHNVEDNSIYKKYNVTRIEYWPDFDVAYLHTDSCINKAKQKQFSTPNFLHQGGNKVFVVGFPASLQTGSSSRMYEEKETIQEDHRVELQYNEFAVGQKQTIIDKRRMTFISNQNGGINPGNSGGPILDISEKKVIGIALKGDNVKDSKSLSNNRSEFFDLYEWLNMDKPKAFTWEKNSR